MTYPVHVVAQLFPPMSDSDFEALVADIRDRGQIEPITLFRGQIIDGSHRARACDLLGREPLTREYDGDETGLLSYVVSLNLRRRHLDESQRGIVAARIANMPPHRLAKGSASIEALSQEKAAGMMNVSRGTVQRAKQVMDEAPDLIPAIERGEMTVGRAITEIRRRDIKERLEDVDEMEAKAAAGIFDTVVIDPPWPMEKIERDVAPNQVLFEYPTMTLDEIRALEVPMADDCHVWLWTTHKFLPAAFGLLEEWGLKYVCTFVWHKPGGFQPFGLPQYNCEFALYARRGTPSFLETKAFPVCFTAPRGAHSEKPEEFYEMLRRVTGGRRLDMFNRRAIDGFETFGKEAA